MNSGKEASFYGSAVKATVPEMELTAVWRALEWIPFGPTPMRIFCDAREVVNAINVRALEWMGPDDIAAVTVKHFDLIMKIVELMRQHRQHRPLTLLWVKGHSVTVGNHIADKLAGQARRSQTTNYTPP
jgi:ribonuclease HI